MADDVALQKIIAELQDKATSCLRDGIIPTFDTDAAIVKSDSAISPLLAEDLKAACLALEEVPSRLKDWHPGSDGKVLDLVHPSLFPLAYGRSKAFTSGHVSLEDCVQCIGKGEIVQVPDREATPRPLGQCYGEIPKDFWSKDFQWLPCQVDFTDGEEVKITSYINNLHPMKFSKLYSVLERCIAKSIPLWNRTLSSILEPRKPRIVIEAIQYDYPRGREVPDDYNPDELAGMEFPGWHRRQMWEKTTRVLVLPEPKDYTSFQLPADSAVNLKTQFQDSGLQVIVKLANIELSPEKPEYEGGSWHIEGQMNERICASALYYYDSDNITESFLAFRQRIDSDDLPLKQYDQVSVSREKWERFTRVKQTIS